MESRVVKVAIGTTNPAKRAAVAVVLEKLFPSGGSQLLVVSVPSGVSAQPFDVHETVRSPIPPSLREPPEQNKQVNNFDILKKTIS